MRKGGWIGFGLTAFAVGGLWLLHPEEGTATRRTGMEPLASPVPGAPRVEPASSWTTWRAPGLQMKHPPEWMVTPAPVAPPDRNVLRLPGLFVNGVKSPRGRGRDPFGGSLQVDLQLLVDVTTATEEIATWYVRNHRDPEDEKSGLAGLFRVPSGSIAVDVGPFEVPAGHAMRRSIRFDVPAGPDAFAIDKNEYFVKRGRDVLVIAAFAPHGADSAALLDTVDQVVHTLSVTGLPETGRAAIALADYLSEDGRDLMLVRTGVTDDDLAVLETDRFHGVVSLSLAETPITDGALRHVRSLPLEVLALSSTAVTDGGLKYLDGMPLRHLMLARTVVTDAGLSHLADLPLTVLDLRGTAVSDAGVAELSRAIQGLHVIR